jgi:hypothetical protein
MATPWAAKHKKRAADAKSAKAAAGDKSVEEWLGETVTVDGHRVERWKIAAVFVLAFFMGPSALGYALLTLVVYLVYSRLYLKGATPASLWAEYTDAATALSKKSKQRKNKR